MLKCLHRFCTFKLEDAKQLDVSRLERIRVVGMIEKLLTIQQRSYTNPHDSHYSVIKSKKFEQPLDRIKEAEFKHFKMNGWSEYQAVYDRNEITKIV